MVTEKGVDSWLETGVKDGHEIRCPVDASGRFTNQAGEQFAGAKILGGEADKRVIEALEESGNLMNLSKIEHSYPHCWRCHSPLIFRATVQWFMNIDHAAQPDRTDPTDQSDPTDPKTHRQRALGAINATRWYPPV